ncbi:MAG: biotin carboxylase N-terminal domain-containing protein [Acidimicrobiales bacterium]|nr:biotin carboxylase N-terminal domain-containing protein [Acidimicrobiales bacterium]
MFDTVIVANRGEIAVRIIRTLRSLGIRSVAVYSDADASARHVADADVARRLGPASAAESYLHIERLIDAALATGAQALHPGYGFLAENSALAAACAEAGIVFVGPPPSAIDAMGDKIRAKSTVAARGVRVVPGVDGVGISDDELASRALEVGFPMLIKPSAGGGGKGMRLVTEASSLEAEIASAKREARGAFGDDTLLIERFIERPRHIEVQVLADAYGNVVHLGERECSLQRRHQKVIEEAPSPFLSPAAREAIGAQAVAAAEACGYVNAGTVEFIVSGNQPDEAFFMEMNTRLQVEHPVTEMVWGIDLVELQLRIANGERLPFEQHDLRFTGHAFEARVYAEDPSHNFLPTGGTVITLDEPSALSNVRVDSGISVGSVVGSAYDPMMSKIIAWGPSRDSARRTLESALASTTVLGLTTNIAFLRTILADPDVVAGQLDTSLVERIAARLTPRSTPLAVRLAAALAPLAPTVGQVSAPWGDQSGWRLGARPLTRWSATTGDGEEVEVTYRAVDTNGHFEVAHGGEMIPVSIVASSDTDGSGAIRLTLGDHTTTFAVARSGRTTWIGANGESWSIVDRRVLAPGAGQPLAAGATIISPMPGTVVSVAVAVGDTVVAGQAIVAVEAMKMEHTLRAAIDGVVAEIRVAFGDKVALNQVLAVLATADDHEDTP